MKRDGLVAVLGKEPRVVFRLSRMLRRGNKLKILEKRFKNSLFFRGSTQAKGRRFIYRPLFSRSAV